MRTVHMLSKPKDLLSGTRGGILVSAHTHTHTHSHTHTHTYIHTHACKHLESVLMDLSGAV